MEQLHFVYKTTCSITGRYYIGVHSTSNLEDGYLGSGLLLKRSLAKYGRENHERIVLKMLQSRELAVQAEVEIVTEDIVKDPLCLNLRLGGSGGNIYSGLSIEEKHLLRQKIAVAIKKSGAKISAKLTGRKQSVSHIENNRKAQQKKVLTEKHKKNISNSLIGKLKTRNTPIAESTKEKISNTLKEKYKSGERTPHKNAGIWMKTSHTNFVEHICPHCGKRGKSGSMFRWHFDNCKQNTAGVC